MLSLLFASEAHTYAAPRVIPGSVFSDLKVMKVFAFARNLYFDTIREADVSLTEDILSHPCGTKDDVLHRQNIFRVFMKNPGFVGRLYKTLGEVKSLQKIRASYDCSFAGGDDCDLLYLRAVNYIFFIKSYEIYLSNIILAFDGIDLSGDKSALNELFDYCEAEKAKLSSPDIAEPISKMLSYFEGKTSITGELTTKDGVFTGLNFDTDLTKIHSNNPKRKAFFDLLRSFEDLLGIYRNEYEIREKGASMFGGDSPGIYMPDRFTGFEKHFLLRLIYDLETDNGVDFTPMVNAVVKFHDTIDIAPMDQIFEEIRFFRLAHRTVEMLTEFSENPLCFPEIDDGRTPLLSLEAVFDPVILTQKLADYQTERNSSNLPESKIRGIIANSVGFTPDKKMYVVTGPNNGGKTAFVRAAGLAVIFALSGMPVPAKHAKISLLTNVLTHFTANETHSLESGRLQDELARLGVLIRESDDFTFAILNETFAGTNSVKALDLFEDFLVTRDKIGLNVIYVTHFHNIAFAAEEKSASDPIYKTVSNLIACVDESSGQRTYKVLPKNPSDTSYSKDIVESHRLDRNALRELTIR
ncbi:hypothetical protein FACS1894219_03550 [Clostridia bacterium]|nr:hypothetical protein FACS1894219_03550 [Clostridia bacterium]